MAQIATQVVVEDFGGFRGLGSGVYSLLGSCFRILPPKPCILALPETIIAQGLRFLASSPATFAGSNAAAAFAQSQRLPCLAQPRVGSRSAPASAL